MDRLIEFIFFFIFLGTQLLIIKNQRKAMASLKELSDKVDELQSSLDAEQEQIQSALEKLQSTVDDLSTKLVDGGSAEDRDAVMAKLNSAIDDLKSTIPDDTTGGGEGVSDTGTGSVPGPGESTS